MMSTIHRGRGLSKETTFSTANIIPASWQLPTSKFTGPHFRDKATAYQVCHLLMCKNHTISADHISPHAWESGTNSWLRRTPSASRSNSFVLFLSRVFTEDEPMRKPYFPAATPVTCHIHSTHFLLTLRIPQPGCVRHTLRRNSQPVCKGKDIL